MVQIVLVEKCKKEQRRIASRRAMLLTGILILFALEYHCVVHCNVTWSRINLLRGLATSHDSTYINASLGHLFADAGEYDKAAECYTRALPPKGSWGRLTHWRTPVPDWEQLDEEDPFNPKVHLGFGELFQYWGALDEAEIEYKQASQLAGKDTEIEKRLANIQKLRHEEDLALSERYLMNEHRAPRSPSDLQPYRKNAEVERLENVLASVWNPPSHQGCLVTRCRFYTNKRGIDGSIEVVGRSGSDAHDRSAVNALSSILSSPSYRNLYIFRNEGGYDCGCMSEGDRKYFRLYDFFGQSNAVELTPWDQWSGSLEDILHTINKRIGALRL